MFKQLEQEYLKLKIEQASLEKQISDQDNSDDLFQKLKEVEENIFHNLRMKKARDHKEPYRIFLADPR
ncbi:MAG: hypothetical protein GY817_08025 [bacterium]|nr:hypothetical protein [bacterium]